MRRAVLLGALIASVAAGIAVFGPGASSGYRFDAVFDTAQGMVAGQVVEIAGARVGTVLAVHLTSDLKARMELQIDSRFAPFHADASCRILPQGLISEDYVECSPGKAAAGPLRTGAGGLPTIPVTRTTEPVSLQDLLNIFTAPTSERLQLMLNELGIATAGEGENINAILRRANPALAQARQVLSIIDAQRQQIGTAVSQTDEVIAQLAVRNRQVRSFVDNASVVAQRTAAHRAGLGESVGRLPALLASMRSSFGALNDFSSSAPPLLADLRAAAPGLTTLTSELPSFISAAAPAIPALGSAAAQGTRTARTAGPVVSALGRFTSRADPTAHLLDQLLVSLRNTGAIEGLQNFLYSLATVGASYDSGGHLATLELVVPPCIADQAYPGCDANFHRPPAGSAVSPAASPSHAREHGATATSWFAPRPASPTTTPSPAPSSSSPGGAGGGVVGGLPSLLGHLLGGSGTPGAPAQPTTIAPLRGLLNYLLK
jgi:phospholipid/cholesterol/gamma-HCH transport system substrate-binding protein